MLTRRGFLVGAGCFAEAGPAMARSERFLCSTPDVTVTRPESLKRTADGGSRMKAVPDPGKLWRVSDGATPGSGLITLDVCFLNGTCAEHNAVRMMAPDWTTGRLARRIAFRFGRPASTAHLRVKFDKDGGNWSDIGRDALKKLSPRVPTMNLADVSGRAIRHEFGHTLGLHHEHQHPNAGIDWNKKAVYRDTAAFGWSRAKTDDNIFGHLNKDCVCIGDPHPDPKSIMMYPIPPEWTNFTFQARLNTRISGRDRRCLEREYRA